MTIDATGKEIVIGQRYGYSKSSNGFTRVIIGTATKSEAGKVTLGEIEEKEYLYLYKAHTTPYKVVNSNRRSSSIPCKLIIMTFKYCKRCCTMTMFKNDCCTICKK